LGIRTSKPQWTFTVTCSVKWWRWIWTELST
jgi:hypothetical protein